MTADSQPTPAASSLIDFLTRQFVPALLVGWLLLSAAACPLQFLVVRRFAAPPVPVADTAAAYRDGAETMCAVFATRAGVPPAEYAPVCAELASDLAAGVTDDR